MPNFMLIGLEGKIE